MQYLPVSSWTYPGPPHCLSVVKCLIPPGAGFDQSVVANSVQSFSPAVKLLSYASPVITELRGCGSTAAGSLVVTNCSRLGGDILTLIGSNFGPRGSQILVGTSLCEQDTGLETIATNSHRTVYCRLPEGSGEQPVNMVQLNGAITTASGARVRYQPCGVGSMQSSSNPLLCDKCQPGKFTGTQGGSCETCASGTYSAVTGATTCLTCPAAGKATEDHRSCSCQAGYYAELTLGDSVSCKSCSKGLNW